MAVWLASEAPVGEVEPEWDTLEAESAPVAESLKRIA
jgi:hypothetical protein